MHQFCFVVRREHNRSVDMFSIRPFRRERNGTIAYRSTFRIAFLLLPLLETEQFYLKHSNLNATLRRSTFRNNTERSRTIALPYEWGLIVGLGKLKSHELNHKFRDKVDPTCLVNDRVEDTAHFMLQCHAYSDH